MGRDLEVRALVNTGGELLERVQKSLPAHEPTYFSTSEVVSWCNEAKELLDEVAPVLGAKFSEVSYEKRSRYEPPLSNYAVGRRLGSLKACLEASSSSQTSGVTGEIDTNAHYDVFISYSNQDREEAQALSDEVEARGGRVFLAPKSISPGDEFVHESIIGTRFVGRVEERTMVGEYPAIRPRIEGSAWITGEHEFLFDDADPLAGIDRRRARRVKRQAL